MTRDTGTPIVVTAIVLTAAAAAAVTVWTASLAITSQTTGIAPDQRPWIVIIMTLAEFGLGCLFLLLVVVWVFGTARIPAWARDAWWNKEDLPPAVEIYRTGRWSAGRVALAVFGTGALVAALGAPLLGIMIGWLLNPNAVLTTTERWGVIAALVGHILWGGYLLGKQRDDRRTSA